MKKKINLKPSPDIQGPDISFEPEEAHVKEIVNKVKSREVFKQYVVHMPFMLSGLDNREEFRSRMAFVDAYKDEFEELHKMIKEVYNKEGDENEFDYLNDKNFREIAGTFTKGENNGHLLEMMKDYMSYRHLIGKVNLINHNSFLKAENKKEKEFRKQFLTIKERSFLIENSSFSDEKKEGIRNCRKWLYRNCAKSGLFNETGSKRNYIDEFARKPVYIQVNALYQVEKRIYKYDDPKGTHEKAAMSEDYIPKQKKVMEVLKRQKRNPYNLYKKGIGDFFYWTRLERAVKKSVARENIVKLHYKALTIEKKLNTEIEIGRKSEVSIKRAEDDRKDINNPVGTMNEIRRVDNALRDFNKVRKGYLTTLKKYRKDRTRELFSKLLEDGNKLERLVKSPDYSNSIAIIEAANKKTKPVSSMIELTQEMRKAPLMDDKTIDKILKEKVADKTDTLITVKGLGDKLYNFGSSVTSYFVASETLEKVTRGFSFGTAVSAAYTSIKSSVMSMVSWFRKKKAESVKTENKKSETEKGIGQDDAGRRLNNMAKVSKKRNSLKAKGYAVEGSFAAASVGFTVLGLVGIVALPLTIASTTVAAAGFGIKYAMDYYMRKKSANKSIDSQVKLEEFEKKYGRKAVRNKKPENPEEHIKFIDTKVKERKDLLQQKSERFNMTHSNRKILDEYLNDSDKVRDRIRGNWAAERGNVSIYSFNDSQDHENVMEAYRQMFLRDPDGPLDENNLLTPKEVKQYMSTKEDDLKNTRQTEEQARRRALFREVMKSEGVQTSAPRNLEEARKMFKAREKAPEKPRERTL